MKKYFLAFFMMILQTFFLGCFTSKPYVVKQIPISKKVQKTKYTEMYMNGIHNIPEGLYVIIDEKTNDTIVSGEWRDSRMHGNWRFNFPGQGFGYTREYNYGKYLRSEKNEEVVDTTIKRSISDIMEIVSVETPKLRFIYNQFLFKQHGFYGKITIKFTINPAGSIIKSNIEQSSTGYPQFDKAILNEIQFMLFRSIPTGNTTVMIPWTFSE